MKRMNEKNLSNVRFDRSRAQNRGGEYRGGPENISGRENRNAGRVGDVSRTVYGNQLPNLQIYCRPYPRVVGIFLYQSNISKSEPAFPSSARGAENKKIPRLFQQKQTGFDSNNPSFGHGVGLVPEKNRRIPRAAGDHL